MSENNQPGDQDDQNLQVPAEPDSAAGDIVRLTHPKSTQVLEVTGNPERYLTNGWRYATPKAPKGNASLEDWQGFARTQGFSDADLEGKSRDDLRAALS